MLLDVADAELACEVYDEDDVDVKLENVSSSVSYHWLFSPRPSVQHLNSNTNWLTPIIYFIIS